LDLTEPVEPAGPSELAEAAVPVEPDLRPGVSCEVGRRLLEWMVLARTVDERLHALYRQGRLRGRLLSGRGQEAIPVAVTLATRPDDPLCPVHRDLGAHLVRGTTVETILLHYLGRSAGPSMGRDGDLHMGEWGRRIFPMVSHLPDSWPVATGFGLAASLRGDPDVTVAFCGDGATPAGAWHESLNFAAVFNTPNVFVVENNGYAYSTPTKRQYRVGRIVDRAAAYGITGIRVDGNDAPAVYLAAVEAVRRARAGSGPTLIEAVTMRMEGHAVHDDAGYVPEGLLDRWRAHDPIVRLETELGLSDDEREAIWASLHMASRPSSDRPSLVSRRTTGSWSRQRSRRP
jgi:TPP-dependent pyruvate/acetoin dehydrogenase alpha subunit